MILFVVIYGNINFVYGRRRRHWLSVLSYKHYVYILNDIIWIPYGISYEKMIVMGLDVVIFNVDRPFLCWYTMIYTMVTCSWSASIKYSTLRETKLYSWRVLESVWRSPCTLTNFFHNFMQNRPTIINKILNEFKFVIFDHSRTAEGLSWGSELYRRQVTRKMIE